MEAGPGLARLAERRRLYLSSPASSPRPGLPKAERINESAVEARNTIPHYFAATAMPNLAGKMKRRPCAQSAAKWPANALIARNDGPACATGKSVAKWRERSRSNSPRWQRRATSPSLRVFPVAENEIRGTARNAGQVAFAQWVFPYFLQNTFSVEKIKMASCFLQLYPFTLGCASLTGPGEPDLKLFLFIFVKGHAAL